jgi:hypothetical protein
LAERLGALDGESGDGIGLETITESCGSSSKGTKCACRVAGVGWTVSAGVSGAGGGWDRAGGGGEDSVTDPNSNSGEDIGFFFRDSGFGRRGRVPLLPGVKDGGGARQLQVTWG